MLLLSELDKGTEVDEDPDPDAVPITETSSVERF